MMQIPCPHCGLRDEEEFCYGGPAHVVRPAKPEDATDVEWARYQFDRPNPRGLSLERWRHTFGCRQWFNMARDTISHDILAVYAMGETAPAEIQAAVAGTKGEVSQ